MTRFLRPVLVLAAVLSLAIILPLRAEEKPSPGADKPAPEKPADQKPSDQPAEQPKEGPKEKPKEKPQEPKEKPKEKPKEEPDPFKAPDGTPEELLKYIDGLRAMRATAASREQFIEFLRKSQTAIADAADKVLAAKPTDEQFNAAAKAKLEAISTLVMVHDPKADARLAEFVEQLQKLGKAELAREGRSAVLMARVRGISGADTARKLLDEVAEFLSEGPVGVREVRLMMTLAQELEYGSTPELAVDAYRKFAAAAAKSDEPRVAALAKRFEAVVRRLELPGKPVKIEGLTMDGKEFDWEKFREGKVVLIDFWATWCGWCIREIPEMKRLYEAYRGRGFEIVGLSGDQTREPLEKFLEKTEVPWTILYGKDGPSPTIEFYGVSAWPTMLLVGKDGNVVSIRARGPVLREELKRLLGPIEEKPEAEEEKPGPETPKAKE